MEVAEEGNGRSGQVEACKGAREGSWMGRRHRAEGAGGPWKAGIASGMFSTLSCLLLQTLRGALCRRLPPPSNPDLVEGHGRFQKTTQDPRSASVPG